MHFYIIFIFGQSIFFFTEVWIHALISMTMKNDLYYSIEKKNRMTEVLSIELNYMKLHPFECMQTFKMMTH